jgi:hypothetical protein
MAYDELELGTRTSSSCFFSSGSASGCTKVIAKWVRTTNASAMIRLTLNVDLFALVTFAFHLVWIKVKVNNRGFKAPFIVPISEFVT